MRPRPNTKAAPHVLEGVYSSIAGLDAKFAQLMKDATPNKSFSNGMMPMLTLPGFIDITVIETLYEPNPGWIRMNRVVQYYQIWREWGDIPRAMLPQGPPKDLVDRVALITQQSQARARGRIEAARVKASIEQQGQEAALRLFDPPGTRYYYT
ncbi:hypothetical protein K504DRAFT_466655 [Pleomassaria siparia CBS 279.74]|uniref:Uncharacterized protein n=1 Tax=Pleomassaria siparia CBS 279.74 TaxID=1314801 RepID=A0A6G1KD01_9PLEO|nr:hypothetical protein K504DRAFT_466655 [Pleomassaria siparia CBS 279.74]